MSQATYFHFYSPSMVALSPAAVTAALLSLGIQGPVRISRAFEGLFEWEDFLHGEAEWPDNEFTGILVASENAGQYFDPEKYLSVDCVTGHPDDRRAQLAYLVNDHFKSELDREFYLNNLVLKVGPHDVYETLENPAGELFARTNFSVAFWGYRHPENLEEFRTFLNEIELRRLIQAGLSEAIGASIDYRIYLT
ncbi:MAG: hypothetical protein JWL90_1611 [Chthoniobacteraceae bacterium]|nr:hypothetical protein [Chthoniobacteraceae bacterium]